MNRGQTLNDFAIGVAVYLLVMGYVFAFAPTLLAPYTAGGDASTVRADRTADRLGADLLAERPGGQVLNGTCTRAFFDGRTPPECAFASTDIATVAGLPAATNANATVRRAGSVLTSDGVRLASGDTPPASARNVARADRVVTVDGRDGRLVVRVW